MTKVVNSLSEWNEIYSTKKLYEKNIGFVPTMGALHHGHHSLIKKCVGENDVAVVSIFVNPTQFNSSNDLKNYPKTFEADLKMLEDSHVDYLFFPDYPEMYPDEYKYKITENDLSNILCGASRPGHFDGVLTVVMKLFNIIKPDKAYFGEKDYQQLKLIEGMVKAFFMKVRIVPCPIVRSEDGLALSSRNVLLDENGRKTGVEFAKLIRSNKTSYEIRDELQKLDLKIDYIEEREGRRFGAVYIGNVRLIDNVEI